MPWTTTWNWTWAWTPWRLVELAAALEERFQIAIKEDGFCRSFTVGELIRFVESQEPQSQETALLKQRSWEEILQQEPPPDLSERIELGDPWGARLYPGLFLGLRLPGQGVVPVAGQGREHLNLPASLICPNHTSFMDGFLIFLATPALTGGRIYFSWAPPFILTCPSSASLVKALPGHPGGFGPAPGGGHAGLGLRAPTRQNPVRLSGGLPLRHRRAAGDQEGVVILAKELGVPIMPAYIQGAHEAWGPTRAFPKPHPVKVIFGPERSYAELAAAGRASNPRPEMMRPPPWDCVKPSRVSGGDNLNLVARQLVCADLKPVGREREAPALCCSSAPAWQAWQSCAAVCKPQINDPHR